jgi:hypothetical protein
MIIGRAAMWHLTLSSNPEMPMPDAAPVPARPAWQHGIGKHVFLYVRLFFFPNSDF